MTTVAQNGRRQRIHSLYLDEREERIVRRLANANGLGTNGVVRNLVRLQLGLPAPRLTIPEAIQAEIDELADRAT